MGGAHEILERAEHAAHAGHSEHGHGGGGPGRGIGITMAILGVMLAFCAAMVGSARTELVRATIEQANLWSLYQAESMKFRQMEANAEILHALTPNKAEIDRFETKLSAIKRAGGKADDEDTAELKEAIHIATTELAEVLTPDKEDEDRLASLAKRYQHDMMEAKEDAEVYDLAIDAHHEAAEHYEWAQLAAEVGIVVASIALLLSSRVAWLIAIVFGIAGGGIIGTTYLHTSSQLKTAVEKIAEAKKRTAEIESEDGAQKVPVHGAPAASGDKPAAGHAPSAGGAHEAPHGGGEAHPEPKKH